MKCLTAHLSLYMMILGIVFLIQSQSISAQGVGVGVDPTCPYPMRSVGGMCILDPSTYVRPDGDGDSIPDDVDPCPLDKENKCPAAQGARAVGEFVLEHHCYLTTVGVFVVTLFAGPFTAVTGLAGVVYATACYMAEE